MTGFVTDQEKAPTTSSLIWSPVNPKALSIASKHFVPSQICETIYATNLNADVIFQWIL